MLFSKPFHFITLHCIALHSLDPELVKMTVGCGTCHINTTEVFTKEKLRKYSGYT
jgi:hypothetical protein